MGEPKTHPGGAWGAPRWEHKGGRDRSGTGTPTQRGPLRGFGCRKEASPWLQQRPQPPPNPPHVPLNPGPLCLCLHAPVADSPGPPRHRPWWQRGGERGGFVLSCEPRAGGLPLKAPREMLTPISNRCQSPPGVGGIPVPCRAPPGTSRPRCASASPDRGAGGQATPEPPGTPPKASGKAPGAPLGAPPASWAVA